MPKQGAQVTQNTEKNYPDKSKIESMQSKNREVLNR